MPSASVVIACASESNVPSLGDVLTTAPQCLRYPPPCVLQVSIAASWIGDKLLTTSRRIECTFCKTLLPSLQFSRSPEATLPNGPWKKASSDAALEKAEADAQKPENKGKRWYQGLVLPGTLDVTDFPFADEKLSVVFEDDEMVSDGSARWWMTNNKSDGRVHAPSSLQLPLHQLFTHVQWLGSVGEAHCG